MRAKKLGQKNIAKNGAQELCNKIAVRGIHYSSTYEPTSAVKRCDALIPNQDGGQRQCTGIALKGKRFCHIHIPELTPKIEAIKKLLLKHGASFFTNNHTVAQVKKILSASQCSKLTRIIDKEFIELVRLLRMRALKDRLRFRDKGAWQKKWSETIKSSIIKWEQIRKAHSKETGFIPYAKYKERGYEYGVGSG